MAIKSKVKLKGPFKDLSFGDSVKLRLAKNDQEIEGEVVGISPNSNQIGIMEKQNRSIRWVKFADVREHSIVVVERGTG